MVEPLHYKYAYASFSNVRRVKAAFNSAAYLTEEGVVGLFYSDNPLLPELKEQTFSLPDLFADRGINYIGRIPTAFGFDDLGTKDDIVLSTHHCVVVSIGDTGGSPEHYVTVFTRSVRESDLTGEQWHVTDIFRLEDDIAFRSVEDLAIYERGNDRHFLILGDGVEPPTFFFGTKAIVYAITGDSPAGIQMQEKWDWPCNHPIDVQTFRGADNLPAFAILSFDFGEPEYNYHDPKHEFCTGKTSIVVNIVSPKADDLSDYSTIAKTEIDAPGHPLSISSCGHKFFVTSREDEEERVTMVSFETKRGLEDLGSYDPSTLCSMTNDDNPGLKPFLIGDGQVIVQPYTNGDLSKLRLLLNQNTDHFTAEYSSLNNIQISETQTSDFIYDTDGERFMSYDPTKQLIKVIELYDIMYYSPAAGRAGKTADDFQLIPRMLKEEYVHASLFPNPSSDIVTVTGIKGYSNISLTTITGAVIQRKAITSDAIPFDISGLPDGFYLVRCTDRTGHSINLRLVKN